MEESRGKAYVKDDGKLGLGHIRRSRMTQDESRGKAYIEDDGKLGLGCIDLGWTVSGDTGPDVWNSNSYKTKS